MVDLDLIFLIRIFRQGFNRRTFVKCRIIKQNNIEFEMVAGFSNNKFYIDEAEIKPNIIDYDDLIDAIFNNGSKTLYVVTNPGYKNDPLFHFNHYQIEVERYTEMNNKNMPNVNNNGNGNVIVNVSSPNSSITLNQDLSVFDNIKQAIEKDNTIQNSYEILSKLDELKHCVNDKKTFGQKYAEFIAMCANHMTLIQPFLNTLSTFL